jgi:hypothetical protein
MQNLFQQRRLRAPIGFCARSLRKLLFAPCLGVLLLQPVAAQTASDSATLKLNSEMMVLYDGALKDAQSDLLATHPVILAMFNGQGGKMVLYRPGLEPLVAERVPIRYELMKSVGHSAMAVFAHAYANKDRSTSEWKAGLESYRATSQRARDTLAGTDMPDGWKGTMEAVIDRNLAFMNKALSTGSYTEADLQSFATEQRPDLKKLIAWSAETQVAHWMGVVESWKKLLGSDWERTYGCSNTLYVTRQNNILFSVLAQYFGEEAMNKRLLLFETSAFTTEPEQMLGLLARIVGDRDVGQAFFGNYYLMDYELMGGDARKAIESEDRKRGLKPYLPGRVPFGSSEWPILHEADEGPASLDDL